MTFDQEHIENASTALSESVATIDRWNKWYQHFSQSSFSDFGRSQAAWRSHWVRWSGGPTTTPTPSSSSMLSSCTPSASCSRPCSLSARTRPLCHLSRRDSKSDNVTFLSSKTINQLYMVISECKHFASQNLLGDSGAQDLVREGWSVQVTFRGRGPARGGHIQPGHVPAAAQDHQAAPVHWLHRLKGESRTCKIKCQKIIFFVANRAQR